jgi:hypothetical protein
MAGMATSAPGEPGEPRGPGDGRSGRRLDQAPSARYVTPGEAAASTGRGSLVGPLAQAGIAAAVGAALLFIVGAVVAATAGLVFVSGVMGAAIGLLLARAAVATDERAPALTRGTVIWLAIGIAAGAVLVALFATWLHARSEGGTLGLVDYLWQTFGPFVPGELFMAALGAGWGASAGPVKRS